MVSPGGEQGMVSPGGEQNMRVRAPGKPQMVGPCGGPEVANPGGEPNMVSAEVVGRDVAKGEAMGKMGPPEVLRQREWAVGEDAPPQKTIGPAEDRPKATDGPGGLEGLREFGARPL